VCIINSEQKNPTSISANKRGSTSPVKKRWKSVALPASYGSWSLVSEPILLGLLVAPSWAGLLLALVGFLSFLIYQPLKIILADRRRGKTFTRTSMAVQVALVYFVLLASSFALAIWLVGPAPLLPLILALPLLAIYTFYDQRPGRHWQAELAAPAAFAAISTAVALASGWAYPFAFALWTVMASRALPAVLYIRARLRLAKDQPAAIMPAVAAHLLALMVIVGLLWAALVPVTAVLAFLILFVRAGIGLSTYRRDFTPMTLGWIETAIGLSVVLIIAIGYWLL
jgi:hypothetical protein